MPSNFEDKNLIENDLKQDEEGAQKDHLVIEENKEGAGLALEEQMSSQEAPYDSNSNQMTAPTSAATLPSMQAPMKK